MPATAPTGKDLLHFVFFLTIHEVGWWFLEPVGVHVCLSAGVENGRMKHVVNFPIARKREAISDFSQGFLDREWPEAFIAQLVHGMRGL